MIDAWWWRWEKTAINHALLVKQVNCAGHVYDIGSGGPRSDDWDCAWWREWNRWRNMLWFVRIWDPFDCHSGGKTHPRCNWRNKPISRLAIFKGGTWPLPEHSCWCQTGNSKRSCRRWIDRGRRGTEQAWGRMAKSHEQRESNREKKVRRRESQEMKQWNNEPWEEDWTQRIAKQSRRDRGPSWSLVALSIRAWRFKPSHRGIYPDWASYLALSTIDPKVTELVGRRRVGALQWLGESKDYPAKQTCFKRTHIESLHCNSLLKDTIKQGHQ